MEAKVPKKKTAFPLVQELSPKPAGRTGKSPSRGRAACTCSVVRTARLPQHKGGLLTCSRHGPVRWGSHGTDVQSGRSCSTFGPGCSRETSVLNLSERKRNTARPILTVTSARIASLLATAGAAVGSGGNAAAIGTAAAAAVRGTLAGNVANLAALVALGSAARAAGLVGAARALLGIGIGAFARKMACACKKDEKERKRKKKKLFLSTGKREHKPTWPHL